MRQLRGQELFLAVGRGEREKRRRGERAGAAARGTTHLLPGTEVPGNGAIEPLGLQSLKQLREKKKTNKRE